MYVSHHQCAAAASQHTVFAVTNSYVDYDSQPMRRQRHFTAVNDQHLQIYITSHHSHTVV